MNNNDWKRLQILRSKGEDGLNEEEFEEYTNLSKIWDQERIDNLPLPHCCDAIQKYPAIYLYQDDHGMIEKGKVFWRASLNEHYTRIVTLRKHTTPAELMAWYRETPEAKFCPFCGTSLPKMKLKKPFPKQTCVLDKTGNYCKTCKESLRACDCHLPESAYEPVEN